MKAYVEALAAPEGGKVDAKAAKRGRKVFAAANCTACHNVDQGKRVSRTLVRMKTIFPGYDPTMLAERPPLSLSKIRRGRLTTR